MEIWNEIWKKILVWNKIWKEILVWNGIFLVWNGNEMEKNCQYGIWKNRFPFHTMPCLPNSECPFMQPSNLVNYNEF